MPGNAHGRVPGGQPGDDAAADQISDGDLTRLYPTVTLKCDRPRCGCRWLDSACDAREAVERWLLSPPLAPDRLPRVDQLRLWGEAAA